jgi:hypothetical protein
LANMKRFRYDAFGRHLRNWVIHQVKGCAEIVLRKTILQLKPLIAFMHHENIGMHTVLPQIIRCMH